MIDHHLTLAKLSAVWCLVAMGCVTLVLGQERPTVPTPGLWKVGPLGDTVDTAGGIELARLYETDGMDEPTALPYQANAALMAAAPELRDALRTLLARSPMTYLSDAELQRDRTSALAPVILAARDALRKADGR